MSGKANITISGAGIAGMSCALALAKNGYKVTIYEKAHELTAIGAGLQLFPNATRLLRNWGVLEDIKQAGIEPDSILMKDGRNDDLLTALPIKKMSLSHWLAPYVTIHRAKLQKILYDSIQKNSLIDLYLDHEVIDYNRTADKDYNITIKQNHTIKTTSSDIFIVSDGVWSHLRQTQLHEKSIFSGYNSWRATVPFEDMPAQFRTDNPTPSTHVYMYENGHFIIYPATAGQNYHFVVITTGKNPGTSWSNKGNKTELLHHFSTWHKNIIDFIHKANDWTYWPIFIMPNVRFSGPQNEILIGDASHATTPFAAQGAAMAIEDAASLSSILAKENDIEKTIKIFTKIRQERLRQVVKRGGFNRFVYHAKGPVAFTRDIFMKLRSPEKLLTDLHWLYNFDATQIENK